MQVVTAGRVGIEFDVSQISDAWVPVGAGHSSLLHPMSPNLEDASLQGGAYVALLLGKFVLAVVPCAMHKMPVPAQGPQVKKQKLPNSVWAGLPTSQAQICNVSG